MAWRTKAAQAAVAAFASVGAVASAAPAARPDLSGIWTSIDREAGAPYANTAFPVSAAQAHFTPAGAEASRYWKENPGRYPGGRCLPGRGPFTLLVTEPFFPLEIVQRSDQVTVISEYLSVVGRIYLDGRKHPADLDPSWLGHSVGHWEGRTLVVDTIGVRGGIINGSGSAITPQKGDDAARMPFDGKAHIVSRFSLLQDGSHIRVDISVTDPTYYTQPVRFTNYWSRAPADWEIHEYFCSENQRTPNEGYAAGPAGSAGGSAPP